jgi:hypothetical protein
MCDDDGRRLATPITEEHRQQAGVSDDEFVVHRIQLAIEPHAL